MGAPDPPMGTGSFEGEGASHCKVMSVTRSAEMLLKWLVPRQVRASSYCKAVVLLNELT